MQNPHVQQKREEVDGPAEAKADIAALDTPAARDAMGALADALDFAARENTRLEVQALDISPGPSDLPAIHGASYETATKMQKAAKLNKTYRTDYKCHCPFEFGKGFPEE